MIHRENKTAKFAFIVSIFCAGFIINLLALNAQEPATPLNDMCPVTTDEKAESDYWLDYEGQRIFFCCRKCRTEFSSNPGPYLANLPARDLVPADHVDAQAHDSSVAHDAITPASPSDHDHDHSSNAGEESSKMVVLLGKFHPLVVHFPIALLLVSFLAEIAGVMTKKEMYIQSVHYLLPLSAVTAVAAASLGWLAGSAASYTGELAQTLFLHRWVGISTAVLAVTAWGAQIAAARGRPWRITYRIILALACVGVSIAGHLGATLIYGADYFSL